MSALHGFGYLQAQAWLSYDLVQRLADTMKPDYELCVEVEIECGTDAPVAATTRVHVLNADKQAVETIEIDEQVRN